LRNDLNINTSNRIDDKGRVPLPAKYRLSLSGDDLILTRSFDPNSQYLQLFFTPEDYDAWTAKWLSSVSSYQSDFLAEQRMLLMLNSAKQDIKLDSASRLRLSDEMRKFANIADKVQFVGMGAFVALMNPAEGERLLSSYYQAQAAGQAQLS